MKKTLYFPPLTLIFSSLLIIISCNSNDGLFGHSETKEEAKANGSTVVEYVPDKRNFNLLDGTKMQIDTAWTEISFTYHNEKKNFDSAYGFHFGIPYTREGREKFSFIFNLFDTTNRVFTNGREKKICYLCPRHLYDTMKVILEQKNPDTSLGWTQPIVTDTITFKKLK
jgi:hypothetical protein